MRRLALVALVPLITMCASNAPEPSGLRHQPTGTVATGRLATVARAVRGATNAPGAIVAVQVGDARPVIVASGARRRAESASLRPDDPFLSASVSKAFAAATVLGLVRDGELGLSDPVSRFVDGWDPRITVRMLLDHTSGLRSWGNKDDPDAQHDDLVLADLERRFAPAESIEAVRGAPLLFEPGTATHYSNANTILAGLVVTAVTGRTIGSEMEERVVTPLRLASSGYAPEGLEPRAAISGVVYADELETEIETAQYPLTSLLTLSGPSIGVVSNAPDLLRLAREFLRGDFPNRALATRARTIGADGAGLGVIGFGPHGYCIFDGCPRGVDFERFGFAGNADGSAVRVVHDPALDATVLVFANSSQRGRLDPFVIRVFRLLGTNR